MPPRNHTPPDPYEHEYAIRSLTAAVEKLTDKVEEHEKEIAKLRDSGLVWKTKWAMLGALWPIAVAIAMKFLPLHL